MEAKEYLACLANEIHTTVMATVDDDGLPVTAAVDIMDSDEEGLYFLTARGKGLYERLIKCGYVALTGIKGNDTMSSVAVSVRGKVRELGYGPIPALFEKNPYMRRIYPTEKSMRALTGFQIYEGTGEWFDLSKKPIERASFVFGQAEKTEKGYWITGACTGCGICGAACPQDCIDFASTPAVISQNHCLRCGNCAQVCPARAVRRCNIP